MENNTQMLDRFEHHKLSCKLSSIKSRLRDENFEDKFVKIVNRKIASNYISPNEKFIVYIFVYYKGELFGRPSYRIYNNWESKIRPTKILGSPKIKTSLYNLLNEIENKNKLDDSKFTIDFYVFSSNDKHLEKEFKNIFETIIYDLEKMKEKPDDYYIDSHLKPIIVDSYSFITKNMLWIFSLLSIVVYSYYKFLLTYLGVPRDIILAIDVFSVIRLLFSVFLSSPILLVVLVFIATPYFVAKYSKVKNFYLFLKGITVITSLVLLVLFISKYNFLKFDKQDIAIDNMFLQVYFYEGFYPRFGKENNDFLLVMGKANRETYYYKLNDFQVEKNEKELCNIFQNEKFTEKFENVVIALLKNSNYPNTKTISKTFDTSKFEILEKDKSLQILQDKYCKDSLRK